MLDYKAVIKKFVLQTIANEENLIFIGYRKLMAFCHTKRETDRQIDMIYCKPVVRKIVYRPLRLK